MRLFTPTTPSDGTLNVFFHGTFAFRSPAGATEITAYLPKLAYHVCRAGNWLGETDLQPATKYTLEGVVTGTERFSRSSGDKLFKESNLIVKAGSLPDPALPFATMIFPLPKKITSLRIADVLTTDFYDPSTLLAPIPRQQVATLQVFTYDIADEANLQLAGHYWEPVFSGDDVNLHIFCTEDSPRPSAAGLDLNAALELLGVDVRVMPSAFSSTNGIQPDSVLPDGVRSEETEDLCPRTERMARLGRLVLRNGEASHAWSPNDALNSNPPACGGCGGD